MHLRIILPGFLIELQYCLGLTNILETVDYLTTTCTWFKNKLIFLLWVQVCHCCLMKYKQISDMIRLGRMRGGGHLYPFFSRTNHVCMTAAVNLWCLKGSCKPETLNCDGRPVLVLLVILIIVAMAFACSIAFLWVMPICLAPFWNPCYATACLHTSLSSNIQPSINILQL